MAETLVKNKVCNACGVDVRPGSLFCYNCGSGVSAAASEKSAEKTLIENNLFSENTDDDKKLAAVVEEDKSGTQNNGKITADEKPKLKSAASMRRKPKTIQRKRVEVVWEEPESVSNYWFILIAFLLTLFAAGLWFIALSLK